ncbi:unnamed protein product [Soboliphyme baturini]|uniref:Aldolase_II domain-containing protein n=1 Tax=Soboliphyme baturini TaxID=241478 RepID=A0A183J0D9_9BILA|nr:unnamed protein product [Soboliphyme baturini]
MERRKRVRQILESKAFREELEQLILSEKQYGNESTNNLRVVVPIADLRGSEAAKYSLTERVLRNKLASLYRLVDLFSWSQGIGSHITLRLSPETEAVLLSPFGYLYHEVSASSLVKVDFAGNVLDAGTTGLGINDTEYQLHALIHRGRPDIRCIIHLHTPVVGAVAAMKCGLLPICHEAIVIGPVGYHDYKGTDLNDSEERESILRDLDRNKVSSVDSCHINVFKRIVNYQLHCKPCDISFAFSTHSLSVFEARN